MDCSKRSNAKDIKASSRTVRRYVQQLRETGQVGAEALSKPPADRPRRIAVPPVPSTPLSANRATWLVMRMPGDLTRGQKRLITSLKSHSSILKTAIDGRHRHRNLSPSREWGKAHEKISSAIALILVVKAFRLSRFCRNWSLSFSDQLLGCFIKADQGIIHLFRCSVKLQHFFYLSNKFCNRFRRNHPALLLPWLEFVFFSVWRTVSCEIESTISRVTI